MKKSDVQNGCYLGHGRAETGVVKFDSDWPGVFIRGDNCFGLAIALRQYLNSTTSEDEDAFTYINRQQLYGLAELLESSNLANIE